MTATRHRPRLDTTIDPRTEAILFEIAKETGLSSRGSLLDFIVNDYVRLTRAARDELLRAITGDGQPSEQSNELDPA